ncbi:FkbM family methyltransferase [Roseovarius sp. 217]|uniref:FkbM family methyltransferase n=1 Tax=Roseovarius sp. (strain 217) TaxID=314264 RepID=UPI0000684999|nr:FkbM family methyltransferase [Roseovarius sp. 217]EAQ25855.1 methyltransferase, FkbM family protein [Roseovarius sp. 217]
MAKSATIKTAKPQVAAAPMPVLNLPMSRGNPYQRLLYSAEDAAFCAEPFNKTEIVDLPKVLAEGQRLLHLHWDDLIFGRSRDSAANANDAERDLAALEAFKAGGGRILWTVHNRSPHRDVDPATFCAARARVVALADLVHVHTPDAALHMQRDWGVEAARLRIIPHPSYLGHYEAEETSLTRDLPNCAARSFLFFGAFRANKGLDTLVDTAKVLLRREVPFHLHLCGRSARSHQKLFRDFQGLDAIKITDESVPDEAVAGIFARAQVFVAPFNTLFTSGSVMLAQGFGLPVIGPATDALRDHVAPDNHDLLYDPQAPRGLLRMMTRLVEMPDQELRVRRLAAFDFAQRRAPAIISAQMMMVLQDLHDGSGSSLHAVQATPLAAPARTDAPPAERAKTRLADLVKTLGLTEPLRILDIGANPMNHDAPYKELLAAGHAHVTGFEPQPEALTALNAQKSANETYFPDVVGDGETHRLNLYRGSGLASLLEIRQATLDHLLGLRRAARPTGHIDLPSRKLDEIEGIGRVDFLKIDVQGAEAMIFGHAKTALSQTLAVQSEVNFFPLYDNQPSFGEIDRILQHHGLVPHSFLHIEKRLVRSKWLGQIEGATPQQMLDGDILYLRDLSQPDAIASGDLRKIALLCDTCYGFSDITLRCLEILVQRGEIKTKVAERFIDRV